jgi:hypothetical protein
MGADPLGLEELGFRVDHAVVLSDQDPAGAVFPQRAPDRYADAGHVADQHDRAIEPFQQPIHCRDVVGQGT